MLPFRVEPSAHGPRRRNEIPLKRPCLGMLLCSWLVMAGCDRSTGSTSPAQPIPSIPVEATQAVQTDVAVLAQAVGWVEPLESVIVRPQIDGQLSTVRFREGQFVNKGDVLFEIDARTFEAEARLAAANLARDRAMAVDAVRESNRIRDLFVGGASASRELESAEAAAAAKEAQVAADEAEYARALLRLEYCTIRAPITGRTGRFEVTPGNIVKENETALVTIQRIDPINIAFSVPEQYGAWIRESLRDRPLPVQARTLGDKGPTEKGEVTFVDSQVDATTGMIRLKATFANARQALWPGQYMQVQLTLDVLRAVIVVPTVAVQTGQEGKFVFAVRGDGTVEMKNVETGLVQDAQSVITSGLEAGETVVTDGHLRLKPGVKIEVRNQTAEPLSRAGA